MAKGLFITGTDTGVGKTYCTLALMTLLKRNGFRVAGMKPIATGAEQADDGLVNEDALMIKAHCSGDTDYELINPIVFETPCAPHIAAIRENKVIDLDDVKNAYLSLASCNDIIIVEGIGGWRVPFTDALSLADMVRYLGLPVIMVVGLRLGCINHALLTAEVILRDDLPLMGWVSNQSEDGYPQKQNTIQAIKARLSCRHLADIPHAARFMPSVDATLMEWLNLDKI